MTGAMTKNVAVVGTGLVGGMHMPAWRSRPDAKVTIAIDSDIKRAEVFAHTWGIGEWAQDLKLVLARPDIQIVDLCLPPNLHADATIACLDAGKHVLVEKPVATTLADALRMADAAERSGLTVMVAENWVFSSAARRAVEVLSAGAIGRPFLVRGQHETTMYIDRAKDQRHWVRDPAVAGGGYLFDAGVHAISLIRHLLGEFASISADVNPPPAIEGGIFDEDAVLIGRLESGPLVALDLTGRARQSVGRRLAFAVFGDRGTLEFDVAGGTVGWVADGSESRADDPLSLGIAEEIAHFLSCIGAATAPLTSVRQQIGSLATVLAAYGSIRAGHPMRPADLIPRAVRG